MDRQRDNQRSKFYDWQQTALRQFLFANRTRPILDLSTCELIVKWAFEQYVVTGHLPRIGDGRRRSCPSGGYSLISLPIYSRTSDVVLEEATHSLIEHIYRDERLAWHGEEFLRLYIDLVGTFHKVSVTDLRKSAREMSLKIAPANRLGKPKQSDVKTLESLRVKRDSLTAEISRLSSERLLVDREISALQVKIRGVK